MLLNRSRAIDWMKRCGLDALIATTPVNVHYFADYYDWLGPTFKRYMMEPGASSALESYYALLTIDGEGELIIPPIMHPNALGTWMQLNLPPTAEPSNARDTTPQPMLGALIDVVRRRKLVDARIGLEFEQMPADERQFFIDTFENAHIGDCSNLLRLIRMVKSPTEIERLRNGSQISEIAAFESLAVAAPGRPTTDLIHAFRCSLARQGADLEHYSLSIRGQGIADRPDFELVENEAMFFDWGCIYEHYFTDTGTTLVIGKATERDRELYRGLSEGTRAAAAAMRPGVKCSQVRRVFQQALLDHGVPEAAAREAHGHGLGLEVRDYPIVVADNGRHIRDDCVDVPSDLVLEENMVINLEVGLMQEDDRARHREQTFVVTADGVELITHQDRSQPLERP